MHARIALVLTALLFGCNEYPIDTNPGGGGTTTTPTTSSQGGTTGQGGTSTSGGGQSTAQGATGGTATTGGATASGGATATGGAQCGGAGGQTGSGGAGGYDNDGTYAGTGQLQYAAMDKTLGLGSYPEGSSESQGSACLAVIHVNADPTVFHSVTGTTISGTKEKPTDAGMIPALAEPPNFVAVTINTTGGAGSWMGTTFGFNGQYGPGGGMHLLAGDWTVVLSYPDDGTLAMLDECGRAQHCTDLYGVVTVTFEF